jgi:hypothetical protein
MSGGAVALVVRLGQVVLGVTVPVPSYHRGTVGRFTAAKSCLSWTCSLLVGAVALYMVLLWVSLGLVAVCSLYGAPSYNAVHSKQV